MPGPRSTVRDGVAVSRAEPTGMGRASNRLQCKMLESPLSGSAGNPPEWQGEENHRRAEGERQTRPNKRRKGRGERLHTASKDFVPGKRLARQAPELCAY